MFEETPKMQKYACAACFKTEDEVRLCVLWQDQGISKSEKGIPYICHECQWELVSLLRKHKAKSKMKVVK